MSKVVIPGVPPVTLPGEGPQVEVGAPTIEELQANIRFLRGRQIIPLEQALSNPLVAEALREIQSELQFQANTNRNPYGTGLENFDLAVYLPIGDHFDQFVSAGLSFAFVVKGKDADAHPETFVKADVAGRFGDVHNHTATASGLVVAHSSTMPPL